MKLFVAFLIMLCPYIKMGQHALIAHIYDKENNDPLIGATLVIKETKFGSSAEELGNILIANLKEGAHTIIINYTGYEQLEQQIVLPLSDTLNIGVTHKQKN